MQRSPEWILPLIVYVDYYQELSAAHLYLQYVLVYNTLYWSWRQLLPLFHYDALK